MHAKFCKLNSHFLYKKVSKPYELRNLFHFQLHFQHVFYSATSAHLYSYVAPNGLINTPFTLGETNCALEA